MQNSRGWVVAAFLAGLMLGIFLSAKASNEFSAIVSTNNMVCDFKGTAYRMVEVRP